MPAESASPGVLVDTLGHAVTITAEECRSLQLHLEIIRSDEAAALASVIGGMTKEFGIHKLDIELGNKTGERLTVQKALASAVWWVMADNHFDIEGAGALVQTLGDPAYAEALDKQEMEMLRDMLKAVRLGGWFPTWLALQLHFIANSEEPDCRYPSPAKIMGTLVEAIGQFDHQAEIAREMVEMRPDMFAPPAAACPTPMKRPSKVKKAPRKAAA